MAKLLGAYQGQGWKRAFWGRRRGEQRTAGVRVQVSMFTGPQVRRSR